MNIIIDTHILLWSLFESEKLGDKLPAILTSSSNDVLVSDISFWEISMKFALGKLTLGKAYPDEIPESAINAGFRIVPMDSSLLASYYRLPMIKHRDPFDRLLIWQTMKSGFTLCSYDNSMKEYEQFGLSLLSW